MDLKGRRQTAMKRLTEDELTIGLKLHAEWFISKGEKGKKLDLSMCDLSEMNLSEAVLYQINLKQAKLIKADLFAEKLTKGLLDNADFTEAALMEAHLDYASLVNSNLCKINGSGVTFIHSNLSQADLTQAYLVGTIFSYANSQFVNFSESILHRAGFKDTDMRYAILQNTNLENAFFSGTRMFGVDMSDIQGLDTIRLEWIDIGEHEPIRLERDEARSWLRQAAQS